MREIKFRGFSTDLNKWVYGYYVKDPMGKHRIYGKPFEEASSNTYYFVTPESVGQFTGLHDKNGVEIYEGEILDCQDRIVKVFWNNQCAQFDTNFIRYQFDLCSNGIANVEWKYRAIVIGNLYQNPELIK